MRPEPISLKPSTLAPIAIAVAVLVHLAIVRVDVAELRDELRETRRNVLEVLNRAHDARALIDVGESELRICGFLMPHECPVCRADFSHDNGTGAEITGGEFFGLEQLGRADVECRACGVRARAWWLGDRDRFIFTAVPWSGLPW